MDFTAAGPWHTTNRGQEMFQCGDHEFAPESPYTVYCLELKRSYKGAEFVVMPLGVPVYQA